MKTLLLLCLACLLAGCAATTPKQSTSRARAPQVLPPLPPGFKTGAPSIARPASEASAARFAPASSESTVTPGTGILQAPEMYDDPDFGRIFVTRAYQGPNTELLVERTSNFANYNFVASYGCWGTEQVFLITTSANFPYQFLRPRHDPCVPTFQPASAIRLGYTHDFKLKSGRVKAALIEGVGVGENVKVWKVLP